MIYLILAPIDESKNVVLGTANDVVSLASEYDKISKNVVCEVKKATEEEELIINFCDMIKQPYPLFAR